MRRPVLIIRLATAALCLGVLAGCNDDPGTDASNDTPTVSASETPSSTTPPEDPATSEPAEETETTAPPADDDPSDSETARAKRAQIPAAKLPGFNEQWKWTKQSSGPGPGQDLPSVCMKSSLTSIGGVSEYRTDFNSPLDENSWAVQQTAVFPDDVTAKTTESVLKAWQAKCAKQAKSLGLKQVKVTPISAVNTPAGPGQQWLVTYRPVPGDPNASWLQAEGFVRDGDTLTYLVMTTPGQDYNYEPGQEPMAQALRVAGKRLIASR